MADTDITSIEIGDGWTLHATERRHSPREGRPDTAKPPAFDTLAFVLRHKNDGKKMIAVEPQAVAALLAIVAAKKSNGA